MISRMKPNGMMDVLWSTLFGMASFLISGMMASILIFFLDQYLLATFIAGGIGGLLLGFFLGMRQKILRMAIAGMIGMPLGLIISFFLVEGFGALLPTMGLSFEKSSVPDIIAIILMGIIFGAVFGSMIYGRSSIWLFSAVCGTVSIPFGFLVAALNSGDGIKVWLENWLAIFGKIDLNFLAIVLSLGLGIGLSIGLSNLFAQKISEENRAIKVEVNDGETNPGRGR